MNLFANETANLLLDLGFEGEWAEHQNLEGKIKLDLSRKEITWL